MSDDSLESVERLLAATQVSCASAELRGAVLRDVQRELQAARWDRWLARAAVILFVVGVGMNAATMLPKHIQSTRTLATAPRQDAIVQAAISVAEVTDMRIGQQVARQLAAMTGRPLSIDDAAAVDAAIERQSSHGSRIGKEG